VVLVRVEGGQPWQDGTLIGTGSIEPGQPYPVVKDYGRFLLWAERVAPSRVDADRALIDHQWLRRVREAFRNGPEWVCEEGVLVGERVPFEGLALRAEPPRVRIFPDGGGDWWESPVDVQATT
jgi:hypothetical protein